MLGIQIHYHHLLWRAGFGPSIQTAAAPGKANRLNWYKQLAAGSAEPPLMLMAATRPVDEAASAMNTTGLLSDKEKQEHRRLVRGQHRDGIADLNLRWLQEMIRSPAQLREKMAFFWHGHFACRSGNLFYNEQLLHIIRTHALGNFGTLLREVSKSAAMINFLNNNQNRKKSPNENFAREVMELFTLGKGAYTEKDVSEAARAFTGWSVDARGVFVFRRQVHDDGTKTVLGSTGSFNGDDVLDILLRNKTTARHIVTKLYQFFVHEKVHAERIDRLSAGFFNSGYDIAEVLHTMFTSEWFYEKENIGSRIKSPIEWWVGLNRQLPFELKQPKSAISLQQVLGQQLFYPPNVAGWPLGKAWIDSSSLVYRLNVPKLLHGNSSYAVQPKTDDDVAMGKVPAPARGFACTIDWQFLTRRFAAMSEADRIEALNSFVLQVPVFRLSDTVAAHADRTSVESFVATYSVLLMQCPEYQVC